MSWSASQKRKRFDVFDFADEDERVERESAEILGRFKNPKRCRRASSPLYKYKFLQCFAGGNEISKSPIDLEVEDCNRTKGTEGSSNQPIELDSEVTEPQFVQKRKASESEKIDGPIDLDEGQVTKTAPKASRYEVVDINASVTDPQCTLPAHHPVNTREEIYDLGNFLQSFSSNYKNERVGMISNDDDLIQLSSASAFSSYVEFGEEQLSVNGSDVRKIGKEDVEITIPPDFIMYRGMYCTEGQLTFSKTFLKFEGFSVNGTKKKISFIWAVGDIISIDAEWCQEVETAIMNFVLQSKSSKRAGNANEISVIESLKFSVYDPCWSERQEAIKSLSVKYGDLWKTLCDKNEENAFMSHNDRFSPKPYFSDLHEHFEEVIYPNGDPDAISISNRDVELLSPETFINDTIIDFYIIYLKNKIPPEEQHRFHFFNSFFFCKLADLDKGLSDDCQARSAFQRVHKWTRKVDIFGKDYIFIPVNYSLHWSLIVICHPGEVTKFKDDVTENVLKVPCILHMDSIRGSHRGLKNLFRSYLSEEWKQRHKEAADDVPSKILNLQFVSLELPQQENSFDCGLFLLHYVELFLLQAPTNFSPFKITESSNFLNVNWFPPAEASLKRGRIKMLIYEILEEQSCFPPSADSIDECSSSPLPFHSEQETGVQAIDQIGNSAETCHDHSDVNNFALSASAPTKVLQGRKDSGKIFDCYEVGGFNTHGQRNAMTPIEEIEESSEEIAADSPIDLNDDQATGSVTEPRLFRRYPRKDVSELRTSWNQHLPLHVEDSVFNKSNNSLHSSEIGLEDDQVLPDLEVSSTHGGETVETISSENSNEDYSDCIVEDSQESSGIIIQDDI
ncbi:Arabidopsis SUMO protease 1, SUMO PROTEASE RELATED TO FERTILITY1 [Hibiscus trionum]|uniref:Arabidopsis SUMO protease 1, SUMO PROTEASE RELATED TO FERTILITY1 n=1 Tax=Hibiscus trionum TaxID=183268 RepID=A0A9W7IVQ8_HIBTR|nr:Arabidopsis SUMO protease 1, SUMO PROTEASE RELATED TO FERTILITY1 [Hibiscus trionum]